MGTERKNVGKLYFVQTVVNKATAQINADKQQKEDAPTVTDRITVKNTVR